MARVTGFEWRLVQSDPKLTIYNGVYCNIEGPNPNDLKLRYDFETAGNQYVFYVTERKEFFDEELGEKSLLYIVNGWDILSPVKHGTIFDSISFSKYITQNDITQID